MEVEERILHRLIGFNYKTIISHEQREYKDVDFFVNLIEQGYVLITHSCPYFNGAKTIQCDRIIDKQLGTFLGTDGLLYCLRDLDEIRLNKLEYEK